MLTQLHWKLGWKGSERPEALEWATPRQPLVVWPEPLALVPGMSARAAIVEAVMVLEVIVAVLEVLMVMIAQAVTDEETMVVAAVVSLVHRLYSTHKSVIVYEIDRHDSLGLDSGCSQQFHRRIAYVLSSVMNCNENDSVVNHNSTQKLHLTYLRRF